MLHVSTFGLCDLSKGAHTLEGDIRQKAIFDIMKKAKNPTLSNPQSISSITFQRENLTKYWNIYSQ